MNKRIRILSPDMVALIPAVCLCLGLLMPALAQAHSLYIQSGRHMVDEGKATPLFFCYGHRFPVDDGVRAKKLKRIRVTAPDGSGTDLAVRNETCLHSYMVDYEQPGTWVLTAETNPGFYTKWVDKKGRQRSTIKPMSAIRDKAQEVEKSLYSKQYAKTYVTCEQPSAQFPAHVGLPLELVPGRDVYGLRSGDALKLTVYRDGTPYHGPGAWDATYTGFSTQPEDMYHPRTQVDDGTFTLPLEKPGRWFVRFFVKTDATPDKRNEYLQLKETATLVIEVPNERIRPRAIGH